MINRNHQYIASVDEIVDALLNGHALPEVVVDDSDEIHKYQGAAKKLTAPIALVGEDTSEDFHERNSDIWFMPAEFLSINIEHFLLEKCQTDQERDRVNTELTQFRKRGLEKVLNLMVYLVDTFRKHNIVWGVGRGSSAASYCLYLIGINRINSIKYNLDIDEFFK